MSDDAIVILIVLSTLGLMWLANKVAVRPEPECPKVADISPEDFHRLVEAVRETLGDNSPHAYALRERLLAELRKLSVTWGDGPEPERLVVYKNRGEDD